MAKKLMALAGYRNNPRGLHFKRGEQFDVDDALYAFLMADAPGIFEVIEPPTPADKALEEPAADKMVKRPKAKK